MLIAHNNLQIEYLLIKAIDIFLLGLVLIIFSFGIYDLFISKLDPEELTILFFEWAESHATLLNRGIF